MVSFTVTATLVTGHQSIIWNGVAHEFDLGESITETVTADTLASAKQQARKEVNLKALGILAIDWQAALKSPKFAGFLYKGRTAIEYIQWISVNITNVQINP